MSEFQFEKMNPAVKEIWIKALGDPESIQIARRLRTKEGMCCLGVLTECGITAGVPITRTFDESGQYYSYSWKGGINTSRLPDPIMEWAGLSTHDPTITTEVAEDGHEDGISATACNDERGYSFQQIADFIRENL